MAAAPVDQKTVVNGAEGAFEALSNRLGKDSWLGGKEPGILDAAVFAYTHLVLDMRVEGLEGMLRRFENLVAHRDRVYHSYFMKS